jgi:hypothetical protein
LIGFFRTQTPNESVPIKQRRGIDFTYLDDYLILVQAPIEQVGQALCQTRQMARWERNLYKRQIELVEQDSFIIFQFQRHLWTVIHASSFFPESTDWKRDLKVGQIVTMELEGLENDDLERMDYLALT